MNRLLSRCSTSRRMQSFSTAALPPTKAQVVVIGGGIIGNSVAYHLAKMGMKDVVLLEQHQLTAGTTWHAAGLMVTFGSLSETSTEIRKYTKELYKSLEEETGQSTGFKPVGFIELATEPDRLEEYRRISAFNRKCGIDVHEIDANEVKKLFPLCKTEDVLAGFYVEDDGRVNPVDATMALAKGARMHGVQICEGQSVVGITQSTDLKTGRRRVTGVRTSSGHDIKAEYVVNCAGMWARQLGELCGVNIPNQAAEHYYLITDSMSEVDPSWPVIEDPASCTYIRPEGGGLMVGLFETKAAAWNVKSIPSNFSFGEIEPDWDRMGPFVEQAMSRVPATLNAGVKTFFCGPESFTPDGGPIVGEAPELQNYFVAAGLNSIGILTGGGIGRLLARWIIEGRPVDDVSGMNIDRFHRFQSNPEYREARVVETLGNVYKCHYPYKNKMTARGAKRTPFHDRLVALGGQMRDVSGWECPDYYLLQTGRIGTGTETETETGAGAEKPSLSWGRPPWFNRWEEEHRACREGVAIIDMSFMSKFLVQGADAGRFLNKLSTANVDGAKDTITYTQWLNEAGTLEGDVTVMKQDDDKFVVIVTDTMHRHAETWMKKHIGMSLKTSANLAEEDNQGAPRANSVYITDVTGAYAQLNIQGPRSRELLQLLTNTDMSDGAFPFRTAREIAIGFGRATCARITYVGELGYELHIPTEHALHIYERVIEASEKHQIGAQHVGLKALASLRLEKGYRDYGHDMDNTDSLIEMGLGFTADMDKNEAFIGKDTVVAQKKELKTCKGLPKRLVQVLVLDPEAMMYHGEILWRDGVRVGDVRAAAYGHTLGGAVGLGLVEPGSGAMVNKAYLEGGKWEVEIVDRRYPAKVSLSPLYDPKNAKIKC